MPAAQAKTVLLGALFSPPEAKKVETVVAKSTEKDKSKWLRSAVLDAAEFWVDGEGWTIADLHGKTVEFAIVMPPGGAVEGPIKGTGNFDVWQNGDGKLKIRIISWDKKSTQHTLHELRIYLPQQAVKLIKRQATGAPCDFLLVDPLFQKCVQAMAKERPI